MSSKILFLEKGSPKGGSISNNTNSRVQMAMAAFTAHSEPGYQIDAMLDLSSAETRKRLSQPACDGFFVIMDRWQVPIERAGELLGGMPRSKVYKLKSATGTLRQDELTRISYIVGIYKALQIILPDEQADRWITQPNDNGLFRGKAPIDYMVRSGIPGLQHVRNLLDFERGRH